MLGQSRHHSGRDRPEELVIAQTIHRGHQGFSAIRRDDARYELEALPAHALYARQRAQRPRLRDRSEEAYAERRERLRREGRTV